MKTIIIRSLLAAAVLLPFTAGAVPIDGDIAMGGSLDALACPEGTCTLGNATGLIFAPEGALVSQATGDFAAAGIGFGSVAQMSDFSFDPFAGVDPLWQIFDEVRGIEPLFSFALTDISVVGQGTGFLDLRGTGIVSGAGFDDTAGSWTFSADGSRGPAQMIFSWSSTTVAPPVQAPEPAIVLLLGLGLIGIVGARRYAR